MKPFIHAKSSARRFGGEPGDYMAIHELIDSSKGAIADNRHRALTHNSWFLSVILERVFGATITNSAGKTVSVRDIGEQHVLEDFRGRFIPTAQDFIQEMEFKGWMQNGEDVPPSFQRIDRRVKRQITELSHEQNRSVSGGDEAGGGGQGGGKGGCQRGV